MLKPLFILSLPRSGSTLMQRVLATDSQIASAAEPWVLLPFVYALKEQGVSAEYEHSLARMALNDFFLELPNGKQDFLSAVGSAVRELYRKAAGTEHVRYFLDKTPRYTLIADEIIDMFPDGKFIYLWRNPLAIIASIIETWGEGKWNIELYEIDLFKGLASMIDAYQAHSENALVVQYESFLMSPEKELFRIQEYLEVKLDPDVLRNFSQVNFKGALGDPTGITNYRAIDAAPLNKWKSVINNPLRKMWCRRYLNWLGEERLKVMGYDLNELLCDLESTHMTVRHIYSDSVRVLNLKKRTEKLLRTGWRSIFK